MTLESHHERNQVRLGGVKDLDPSDRRPQDDVMDVIFNI